MDIDHPGHTQFGIQWKFTLLLTVVIIFVVAIVVSGLVGLQRVASVSSRITEDETPLVRSIQEALSNMVVGQSATERALDIDDPAQAADFATLETTFSDSIVRFNMFMAAITWGSESDAFKSSGDGVNYTAWVAGGLADTLVIKEPSAEEVQLAGETNIYYDGFVNNASFALVERKLYLTYKSAGKTALAEEAKQTSKDAMAKARHFAELSNDSLSEMVHLSNLSTAASAAALRDTQKGVEQTVALISIIGGLVMLVLSILFARRVIIGPLRTLSKAAREFGEGQLDTRIDLETGDEIETLALSFNRMAENLARHTETLEKEVKKRTQELGWKVEELDTSNQMLAKREEDLTLVNDRLRELDKAKSEFISVAAHQLRTPLSAIKWTLSLIIDEDAKNLTSEQRSLIMKGYESNERIIRLVNEMLVVTRIEAGKVVYTIAPFHIDDLIDSVLLDFEGAAQSRHISLSVEKSATPLPYVNADSEKMRAVIQNLVENSMRYTKDGGTVSVRTALEGDMVRVSIKDNGIGIPAAQQSSIFNKFFRADNATKTQTDGSGLGLFVAKSAVEKQGGTIGFESTEGVGSTFSFTIPCAPVTV